MSDSKTNDLPLWALRRAAEITEQTVPQAGSTDARDLYEMTADLKTRLTTEIAGALVAMRPEVGHNPVAGQRAPSKQHPAQCVGCGLYFPKPELDGMNGKLWCLECDTLQPEGVL